MSDCSVRFNTVPCRLTEGLAHQNCKHGGSLSRQVRRCLLERHYQGRGCSQISLDGQDPPAIWPKGSNHRLIPFGEGEKERKKEQKLASCILQQHRLLVYCNGVRSARGSGLSTYVRTCQRCALAWGDQPAVLEGFRTSPALSLGTLL